MKLKEKAAKGVFWSVAQQWGMEAISFLTFIFLARLLTPEDFGLVALAAVFMHFIKIFLDQGFGAAIVQRTDIEREHLDTAFWTSILMGLSLTIISIAASGLVAGFFDEPSLAPILVGLSLGFFLGALGSIQNAILRREFAFKSLAARSLIATTTGSVVGVSMAFAGYGVWSLVAQNLVQNVVDSIALWWASDWRPRLFFSKKHFNDLFGFGISIVGSKTLEFTNRRSDDFLIGYFLGPTQLGFYSMGYRLLLVMIRMLTGITNFVAAPTFSRLQDNPERMRRVYYKVTQISSLLAFPAFIGLGLIAPELIPALFGENWTPSVPVMQILVLIGMLSSVMIFNGSIMKASGKPSWHLGILILTSVSTVIGFLLAVQWGIVAVAASFVIVSYLLAPISYIAVHRLIHIDIKKYLGLFVVPLSASLIMIAVISGLRYLLRDQDLNVYIELFLYISAGIVTYLLVVGLAGRSIARQVLEIAHLSLPDWKFLKGQKFFISVSKENPSK
jgi:O-antigen/teichoic acid export membrane protein